MGSLYSKDTRLKARIIYFDFPHCASNSFLIMDYQLDAKTISSGHFLLECCVAVNRRAVRTLKCL
jgi:hypothetical protein